MMLAGEYTMKTGGFPIETGISSGFPIATFDYRRVAVDDLTVNYG